MPEAHGTATTNRIEELFSLGYTIEEIRLQPSFCNVSERTLKRWLENFKWNGTIRDQWTNKRKRCEYESGNLSPALGDFVVDLLEEDPSLYLREVRDEIEWTGSFEVPSISNDLYKFLKNRGLSRSSEPRGAGGGGNDDHDRNVEFFVNVVGNPPAIEYVRASHVACSKIGRPMKTNSKCSELPHACSRVYEESVTANVMTNRHMPHVCAVNA